MPYDRTIILLRRKPRYVILTSTALHWLHRIAYIYTISDAKHDRTRATNGQRRTCRIVFWAASSRTNQLEPARYMEKQVKH